MKLGEEVDEEERREETGSACNLHVHVVKCVRLRGEPQVTILDGTKIQPCQMVIMD